MQKIFVLFIVVLALSGCVRKLPIEQGNIFTPEMINQVHLGMTEEQVKQVMGSPVLMNTFRHNRLDYVYTLKPGQGAKIERVLTLIFQEGHLTKITGNLETPSNES